MRRPWRRLGHPHTRLAVAGAVAAAGAYLVALWAVGAVLIVEAAFYVLFVWDDGKPTAESRSPVASVLDDYRRSG